MKTRRIIMIIAFILLVISLTLVVILNKEYKIYGLFSDILTGTILTIVLEIPNIIDEKEKNKRVLFCNMLYSYIALSQYIWWINEYLNKNNIIQENFNLMLANNFEYYINNISTIDDNLFIKRCKNDKLNNIKQKLYKQAREIGLKNGNIKVKIIQCKIQSNDPCYIVRAKDIEEILRDTASEVNKYIENYNEDYVSIFSKKEKVEWNKRITILKNELSNYKNDIKLN